MRYLSRRMIAASVADRYKQEHAKWDKFQWKWDKKGAEHTYRQLMALGPNPSPEDIEKTDLKGWGWTELKCGSCHKSVESVMIIEGSWGMCRECVNKAHDAYSVEDTKMSKFGGLDPWIHVGNTNLGEEE